MTTKLSNLLIFSVLSKINIFVKSTFFGFRAARRRKIFWTCIFAGAQRREIFLTCISPARSAAILGVLHVVRRAAPIFQGFCMFSARSADF